MNDTTSPLIPVWMGDFSHHSNTFRTFPLGVGTVAAYAHRAFKTSHTFHIFKSAETFFQTSLEAAPTIVAISSYVWNAKLTEALLVRLKQRHPRTVVILGGPNYPLEPNKQREFFQTRPWLDFFVVGEGEVPFAALLGQLMAADNDPERLKASGQTLPGCHYLYQGQLVTHPTPKRLTDLNQIPSPYLDGLLDHFFPQHLSPLLQLARGCPFACTYCSEGDDYYNKIRHYDTARFEAELRYIAARIPDKEITLHLADSNFGMFSQDVEACAAIRRVQDEFGWPIRIDTSLGKNRVETILNAVKQLKYGTVWYSAALQSTSENVLRNIKRRNISTGQLFATARATSAYNKGTNSEIILNLPGDSRADHLHTVREIIEGGISRIRMYTLLLLTGTEIETAAHRQQFGLKTRFRVLPRNFGHYQLDGERVPIAEIGEIIVESDSMDYEAYLYCRLFDLSVEVFYNDHYFLEVEGLLEHLGLSMFDFVLACHDLLEAYPRELRAIYQGLQASIEKELWESQEKLEAFIQIPGNLEQYAEVEHENSLATNRALAVFTCGDQLHDIARRGLLALLERAGRLDESMTRYVEEMIRFSWQRKRGLLEPHHVYQDAFAFDFQALAKNGFHGDPLASQRPQERRYSFWHEPEVASDITRLYRQGQTPVAGIRNILFYSIAANPADHYYRSFAAA
ncbi:MAG: cobalamin-dependent protein [Magnetococcales bacterium]|nr:cobalamin-dependent protein [Magnetococcales bacterium]